MARNNGKKESPLKNLIKESVREMNDGEFPDDPELEVKMSGPERFAKGQKQKDEVVIDQLLAGIQGKAGYFLKLKKEVRPNEYMLMKVIESDWRRWADIETEVSNIVIEHTKIAPQKWGTGQYRVEYACKGGMRGATYDPIDYFINAEEEFNPPQTNGAGQIVTANSPETLASRLEELGNLVQMISGVMPKPQDPAQVNQQIATAFREGLQQKANESNSSNAMMTALITSMMGMMTTVIQGRNNDAPKVVNLDESMGKMLTVLKDFGVLGGGSVKTEKTVIDFAKELKELGLDLFKKDDPLEQVNKIKQLAGIAADFMGMGGTVEKPSIFEKIVDMVGPAIPKMIEDAKATMANAAQAQQLASQNMERAKQLASPVIPNEEPSTYQQMSGGSKGEAIPVQTQTEPVVNEQVKAFFDQIYVSVRANNKLYYPVIYTSLLQDPKGAELINGIVQGSKGSKELVDLLQEYGDKRFKDSEFVMKYLVGYTNGFVVWLKSMMSPQQETVPIQEPVQQVQQARSEYDVQCNKCGTVYSYESEMEFALDENKKCEIAGCDGTLVGIRKVV